MDKAKQTLQMLLSIADITIDGSAPYDIRVNDERFYKRVLSDGALGLGESYMDGWWECDAIDQFIDRVIRARLENRVKGSVRTLLMVLKSKFFNLQKISRAFEVGIKHYDIGNDLYRAMLDKRLNYTCGYWQEAKTLDEAQEAKL
ncbi:MAG: cyclopropane-fatty-acyl-phospholipid synthase, partial [FCB group bacterium]|nr:cyclopropane-fatty-acyl-phospholipid synthase [FCB group bacterium]